MKCLQGKIILVRHPEVEKYQEIIFVLILCFPTGESVVRKATETEKTNAQPP